VPVVVPAKLRTCRRSSLAKNRRFTPFKFYPGKTGGLSAKDFRYFQRLLDSYVGLLAGALCSLYLIAVNTASPPVFWVFILIILVSNGSLTFNCFGLDNRSGLNRYTILPVNGKAILFSKNLAFVTVITIQLFPMTLLAGWRLGLGIAFLGLIESALLALAYLIWGNWMAVNHPFMMQLYRFSSGGSPIEAIGGALFGSLPGVLAIWLFQLNKPGFLWAILFLLPFYSALYLYSLLLAGRNFERKRESLAVW
jgi:hypothetical protein